MTSPWNYYPTDKTFGIYRRWQKYQARSAQSDVLLGKIQEKWAEQEISDISHHRRFTGNTYVE